MTKLMTQTDASRIQSTQAKKGGGKVEKSSFSSRVIKAGVRNASGKTPPPNGPSKTGNPSGGGRGNNPPSKR
jgi:hypothetical protein